jgi:hypothetical protein
MINFQYEWLVEKIISTEIHRISDYDFRTDAHFAVIFKNTKISYFRRPSATSAWFGGKIILPRFNLTGHSYF